MMADIRPWVIGNWKLNPLTLQDAVTLATTLKLNMNNIDGCHVMVAPSFIHTSAVSKVLQSDTLNSKVELKTNFISVASQDVSGFTDSVGAYTGEVSASQLKDIGVEWVILGHSERRQFCAETNKTLYNKMLQCAKQGLGVIFCVGESEAQFEATQTKQVLADQLQVIDAFIKDTVTSDDIDIQINNVLAKLIIAYEPIWAIGTGKVPSVLKVEEVHQFIKVQLLAIHDSLRSVPVIYGGSVKPENANDFAACAAINGVLVGGAALQAQSFAAIAKSFAK